jgi:O-methyltransferase
MSLTELRARLKRQTQKSRFIVKTYRRIYSFFVHMNKWFRFWDITSGGDIIYLLSNLTTINLLLKVRPYTMITFRRLATLYKLASRLERDKISGSYIECGVRNGGSAAVIAAAAAKNKDRQVWLFDSWEGLPEPDEIDILYNPEDAKKGSILGEEANVRELLFSKLKLNEKRIHLVKGWFSDTLPGTETGKIALLHLDCDLYQSVKDCLENLYDKVTGDGCIVVDDYGYWSGSKKAIDEFIQDRDLKVNIVKVESQGVYFFKNPLNSISKTGKNYPQNQ